MYGRTADHPANQQAIANRAQANRNGNGDVASGDGWRYRGRGIFQLTGRANYRAFSLVHTEMFGEVIDFEKNPDLLFEPKYAVRSALFFWSKNGLYAIADRGVNEGAANAITRIINRRTDTYEDRWKHVEKLHKGGVFNNVCKFSVARPRFQDK
ncbi:MAG: glycoside hydrolase family 19 protein [Hyphomicrobiales bacterium]